MNLDYSDDEGDLPGFCGLESEAESSDDEAVLPEDFLDDQNGDLPNVSHICGYFSETFQGTN